MADEQAEVVIRDAAGTEHVFPPGFDPQRAAQIVRESTAASAPSPSAAGQPKWYQPGGDALLDNVRNIAHSGLGVLKTLANHPTQTLATAGAMAAVPITGGVSGIPAVLTPALAAAGGGAVGAGIGQIVDAVRGNNPVASTPQGVLKTMAEQGALQGAAEGGGQALSAGLRKAAEALYPRFPVALTQKYGNLSRQAIDRGLTVGDSRLAQTQMLASKAKAAQMVQGAEDAGRAVNTKFVTDQFAPLQQVAADRAALGVPGDASEVAARQQAFESANPKGYILPSKALAMKQQADTLANTAQRAVRSGNVSNDMTARLNDATRAGLKEGLEYVTPGLEDQNANTSALYGLSRGLRTMENRPHQLLNIASLGTGMLGGGSDYRSGGSSTGSALRGAGEGALMRFLLAPSTESKAAVAVDALGRLPMAQLIRAAMLARLSGDASASPNSSGTP